MAGIRILERNGDIVSHSSIWAGPEEVPVVFVIVKDGATALAHPDYVGGILYDIDQGDITIEQAWDVLLIKTPKLAYPQRCTVRVLGGTGGGGEILIGKRIVHRIGGVTE
jgi:hypothetical protein